ncbi:TPA: LTA synthase family protein, partial [Klebsiella pneumoniae]
MPLLRSAPMRYLFLLLSCWLIVFSLTRLTLLLSHLSEAGGLSLQSLAIGLLYDLGFLAYAGLPAGLALLLCPARFWQGRTLPALLTLLLIASLFLMGFVATAEWLFWDEFGVRFNFIAVDYLVYSKEVLNNLLESYPIGLLLSALALLAMAVTWLLRRPLQAALRAPLPSLRQRLLLMGGLCSGALLAFVLLGQDSPRGLGGNSYQYELASNGPYQFFAAFRNNELDYNQLYSTLTPNALDPLLRAELAEPNARFSRPEPLDIRRQVSNPARAQQLNVVLVTIESLSAKYLGSFGDNRGLTPNLDALRGDSLFFSNLYASGTRTDRGMEAITLSIPPTPGRSIVKRIGRESGYSSLGQQLSARGYDSVFVYGGRGYFDNMNAFFAGNGYRVVDQSSVDEQSIHFKNAWGMADEDLYSQA